MNLLREVHEIILLDLKMAKNPFLLFATLILLLVSSNASSEPVNLTIFAFSDIYEIYPNEKTAGVAALKKLLLKERSKCKHSLTLVSGDILSTNGELNKNEGKHIIKLMNDMKIDMASFGNHEFAFGVESLKKRIAESNFSWLSTNVLDNKFNLLGNSLDHKIYNIGGIKIGFIGICLTETKKLYYKQCKDSVRFLPIFDSTKKAIEKLKENGVDFVIALTHLNLEDDKALARTFPDIKLIVGGHDHDPVAIYENGTLIQKSGSDGAFLGRIDLQVIKNKIDNSHYHIKVIPSSWETIANPGTKPCHVSKNIG